MKLIGLFLLAVAAFGQANVIDSGNANGQGFGFFWETRLDPGTPELADGFGRKSLGEGRNPLLVYRVFLDRRARSYFGYEATITAPAAPKPGDTYRIVMAPLELTTELERRMNLKITDLAEWKRLGAVSIVQTLRIGDVVGVTLMTNPATNQRIIDYVTIQEPSVDLWSFNRGYDTFNPEPARQFAYAPGDPRDFTPAEAEFSLSAPRLIVNGVRDDSAGAGIRTATGRTILVALPQLGRITLSLVPAPGFAKAGEVRGTSLRFSVGSDKLEVQSAARIAPGSGPYTIYVKQEPGVAVSLSNIATGGPPALK
ncbi:MAG: hypothetical protein ABI811_09790 [Acidobacteriota bacterium]